MKNILMLCLVAIAACGKDECKEYATVWCGKIALCVTPIERTICEKETLVQIDATDVTQEQCSTTKDKIKTMDCPQFKQFLKGITGR